MSNEPNAETQDALKREIKSLKSHCLDTVHIIENAPIDAELITNENVLPKKLTYIEGLRLNIENSNTHIVIDENLLSTQFLNEVEHKTSEVDELKAYTRGCIHDIDKEIKRLKTLVKTSQEVKLRPKAKQQDVKPQHIQRAKEKFQMMKNELHGLIHTLYPGYGDMITEVMGELMMLRMGDTPSDYITITSENYQLIEFFKDMNIVMTNPYNNMEVKLAY